MKNFVLNILLIGALAFVVACGGGDSEPTVDCSASGLAVNVSASTDAMCTVGGTITAAASGGSGSITYSLDGSTFQASGSFSGLAAGQYTVTAKDAEGCTSVSSTVTISEDMGDIDFTAATTNSGCGTSDGSITLTATGGDGNYMYQFPGASLGTSNTLTSIVSGEYSITVQDGNGCETTEVVTVLNGTSYTNSVSSIIANNCATANCHVSGTGRQDFTDFATVQANATGIMSRTASGDMPRGGGTLTQGEIDLIACWVNDGALDN